LRLASSLVLVSVLFWPDPIQHATSALVEFRVPVEVDSASAERYLRELDARGITLENQGVRVETLSGDFILASHQEDATFNPASVIKIATSMAALERFGPDYRFETAFHVDGSVADGTLEGDLILRSDGDPEMDTNDLVRLAREVIQAGVRRVEGRLVIAGPFTVGNLHQRSQVGDYLVRTLRRIGLRVPEEVSYGPVSGTEVARRVSDPLRDIVFYQNAHSVNEIADRLGEAVGGPRGVEDYLIGKVGIPDDAVRVQRASGLRRNRITARGTIMMLRRMAVWLEARDMTPEDIMPVAGMDPGTLRLRLNRSGERGAVVAKTGTLISTDGGVSALAGVIYTEAHGPVLFALLNARGPVLEYRNYQDRFVRNLLAELGGRASMSALARRQGS
jgi:D-alanyl-D-alanine carboxypeptidase/D-alanyl-D-alanine-endopeptidase (penicillin-binding protein 4)